MLPARIPMDATTAPYAALLLRLTLGLVFIAHGLFKVLVLTLPATAAEKRRRAGFRAWAGLARSTFRPASTNSQRNNGSH